MKACSYHTEMSATYEDLSPRRERNVHATRLLILKKRALELLREALSASTLASDSTEIGNKKKVWKATYEAVIASAPVHIREVANFLRNYHGRRAKIWLD
jgi:hypothetical protein